MTSARTLELTNMTMGSLAVPAAYGLVWRGWHHPAARCLSASCEKQGGKDDEYSRHDRRRSRNQASDHDDMAEILMSGA